MKKIIMVTLVGLFLVGGASTAKAVSLPTGAFITLPAAEAVPGSVSGLWFNPAVFSYNFSTVFGTITENVYRKADNTLLFTYVVNRNDATVTDGVTRFNALGFENLTVSGGYVDTSSVNTTQIDRFVSGSIGFNFNLIPVGGTSDLLWLDTNAQYLRTTDFGVYGATGGQSTPVHGIGPTATPEPGTVALFSTGLLGLLGFRRKRLV